MKLISLLVALREVLLEKLLPTVIWPSSIGRSIAGPPRNIIQKRSFIHTNKILGDSYVDGDFWIEEHRTPNKGKSSSIPLTSTEILQLQKAVVKGHKLYFKSKYVGNVHYDLRIRVNNHITSFVVEDIPQKVPVKLLAVLQPTHYNKDPSIIMSGYGKGVKLDGPKGACIMWHANNHVHVVLEGFWKQGYAFIPLSANEYLMQPLNPKPVHFSEKTKMKLLLFGRDDSKIQALIHNDDFVASAKKDGSRVNITHEHIGNYTYIWIGSYRPDKVLWKLHYKKLGIKLEDSPRIQYNYKLNIMRVYDPHNRIGRVKHISAEIWSKADTGTIPRISPKLQVNDFKARRVNIRPYIYPHTVYDKMSVKDKWDYLMSLRAVSRGFYKQLPHASTTKGKLALVAKCRREVAVDGVVFLNIKNGEIFKAKNNDDYHGTIVGIQRIKTKDGVLLDMAIPIVKFKKVTMAMDGELSDEQMEDLYKNEDSYIGNPVHFRCTQLTKNNVPFQPVVTSIT